MKHFKKSDKQSCFSLVGLLFLSLLLVLILWADAGIINAFAVENSGTQPISNLLVGDRVMDPDWQWQFRTGHDYTYQEGDETKPVIWIIVAVDHYGEGSGVTLLSEELIGIHAFDNSTNRGSTFGSNHWGNSGTTDATRGLRPWLNSTGIHEGEGFYNAFSGGFKLAIITTILPNKVYDSGSDYTTADMVFIPSTTELGDDPPTGTYEIGTVYPLFDEALDDDRIAQLAGIREPYWTRSPHSGLISDTRCVNDDGEFDMWYWALNAYVGVRPALSLSSDTLVSATPNDDGVYALMTDIEPIFTDVPPDHPFYHEIKELVTLGIAEGWPDGTFRPSNPVTRQAAAAFLFRAFELEDPGFTEPSFSDVDTDHPFFAEIESLAASGIVEGWPDGTFRPTLSVTRQAAAAFLYRVLELEDLGVTKPTFNDVPTDHFFFKEIEALAATGITTGWPDGTFRPTVAVTRQAMAAFLIRALELNN